MSQASIFFLHNPKAGGSSLRRVLSELSGPQNVAPVFSNAPNDHRINAQTIISHRGYDLYAGHYGYEIYRALSDGHVLVTNFRDPVQRIYSIYRYWRHNVSMEDLAGAQPNDVQVVRLAQELSFSEFIRANNDDLRLYISNFHFRQLHRTGWAFSKVGLSAKLAVKRRIRKMPWFYIAETPDASALLLQRTFPGLDQISFPQDNKSGGDAQPIQLADAEHLIRMNMLDYEIYAYAVSLQSARLAEAFS
jgi:hypothetical protein